MNKLTGSLAPLVVLGILLTGCGKSTKGPKTVAAKGTLTIGGSPGIGVIVTLHPVGEGLQMASGKTNDTGEFELTTGQTGTPGAMVGKYKVVLTKAAGDDESYMNQTEDNTQQASDDGSGDPTAGNSGIPEKYTKASSSDYEIEISGPNKNIEITIE